MSLLFIMKESPASGNGTRAKEIDDKLRKNGKVNKRSNLKVMFHIILFVVINILFLSAVSAYIRLSPKLNLPSVPLRMLLQMTMKIQIPIIAVTIIIYTFCSIRKVINGREIHKASMICVLLLICIVAMETCNWIKINNAKSNMSNLSYSSMSPGKGRGDYHLLLKQSYAKELDMTQCEVYQDSSSEYKSVCLIYLNYGGWAVQSEKYGTQIKNFCENEGYTFVRFAVERNENEDILALTQKINTRLNALSEKENFKKVVLCGGSAGGHLALLCAGKKSGDISFPIPEIQADGVIALYPCVDPGYAYDYYVNSDSKYLAKQTKNLDEAVFGIRGDKNSLYDVTAISNCMEKKIPMLIVHGENDSMMPVEGTENLYQDLSKRGYPISFLKLNGVEHVFDMVSSAAWDRCAREMTGFLRSLD